MILECRLERRFGLCLSASPRAVAAVGFWIGLGARCLFGVLLAASMPAWAGGPYLENLQARAAALQLADTRAWHALLHYEDNVLQPGVTSTVTTGWFFRAPDGRSNPGAELAATLAGFFESRDIAARDAPVRCVFPARYRFLDRHLHMDAARLPQADCQAYRQWKKQLDPAAISLVFPAAYMNNPASMFGHTLLRVDGKAGGQRNKLLAHAVNFAATAAKKDSALMYAFKGLTGGYPGSYGVFPFYKKVKEYAWIENRDIWSYPLALTQVQLNRLVAHLWALQGVTFDYYFFTKNCAYQLLALLEVARPQLHLTESFDWYAIPADTIRRLARVPGLLGAAEYRPALATRLKRHVALLTESQRALALAVTAGRVRADAPIVQTLPARVRARVLAVAHDYLYYQQQAGRISGKTAARAEQILLARSRIPLDSQFPPVPQPTVSPAEGHGTLRLAVGGVWERGLFSLGLRVRPAYHDLLDPPGGYTAGAQISFLDLRLRIEPDDSELEIAHLALIDITSISTRGPLFQPISWRISTGLRQRPVSAPFDPNAHLGYYLQGGPGLAWGDAGILAGYVFGLASADVNHGFEHGYAVGAGGSVGVMAYPVPGWQLRAEAGVIESLVGDPGRRSWLELTQQWRLLAGLNLRFGIGYHDTVRHDFGRVNVMLQGYF